MPPFTFKDTPCGDIVCHCSTSFINATLLNATLLWVAIFTCFIVAAADGCEKCYACLGAQSTCNDVPGMTLEYAVAISTASRMFGLYLMLTGAWFWNYVSPALEAMYPPPLLHTAMRVLMVVACFLYYINPPHIEAEHSMCSTDAGTSITYFDDQYRNNQACIRTNALDQYQQSPSQRFSVVFFWVIIFIITAIINCQMITLGLMNWNQGGQGVQICMGLFRICIFVVMLVMTILAATASSDTRLERGASIFWYELSAHMMLLLYFLTFFYELGKNKLAKDDQQANQTETNLQDGQAHRSNIQLQNVVEHKSPVHTQFDSSDAMPDMGSMGALTSSAAPMPVGI